MYMSTLHLCKVQHNHRTQSHESFDKLVHLLLFDELGEVLLLSFFVPLFSSVCDKEKKGNNHNNMFGTNQSHLLQQEWSLCCHRQPSHPLDSNLCQPKILFCQNSNILETNESWICNVPIYIIYIKIHIFPFNCLAPRLLFVICRVDLYNLYFMFCNLYAMKIHIIFK